MPSTNFVKLVRLGVLNLLLALIHLLVLTPIALLMRNNSRSKIAGWKNRNARIGWFPQEQSTSQKENYRSMS